MNDTLMYFLKVNIAIALFYLFYRLFFAGDTFWKTRRYYLLFSVLVSFVYPLLSIENWLEKKESVKAIVVNYAMLPEFTVTPVQQTNWFSVENILLAIYGLGVMMLLVRMMAQLIFILRLRMQGNKEFVQGISIITLQKEVTPFSFFNAIFMNPTLHNEYEKREIIAHELTHIRQRHSFDVLISELVSIAFWFNPATWLLKREIRQNLEFLADDKVIESGFDSKAYQYHLLQLSYQTPEVKLGNKFNVSPLKKRIIMMNQQRTSKAGLLKYSLIVPLALALIVSSNAQTVVKKAKSMASKTVNALTASDTTNVSKKVTIKYDTPENTTGNEPVKTSLHFITQEDKSLNSNSIDSIKPPIKTSVKFSSAIISKTLVDTNLNTNTLDNQKVYSAVEKMPEYPGGVSELMSYLAKNIKYPVEAQKNGVQGTVIVRFIVNNSGKVEQAKIIKTNAEDAGIIAKDGKELDKTYSKEGPKRLSEQAVLLEQEALRVVNAMPKWTPGEQKGKKVAVYYTLPIKFKLEGGTSVTTTFNGVAAKSSTKISSAIKYDGEAPLYIVDGKEVTESDFNAIKPENIQSINVLKGESATKAYGDKGKNRVVEVKLKK